MRRLAQPFCSSSWSGDARGHAATAVDAALGRQGQSRRDRGRDRRRPALAAGCDETARGPHARAGPADARRRLPRRELPARPRCVGIGAVAGRGAQEVFLDAVLPTRHQRAAGRLACGLPRAVRRLCRAGLTPGGRRCSEQKVFPSVGVEYSTQRPKADQSGLGRSRPAWHRAPASASAHQGLSRRRRARRFVGVPLWSDGAAATAGSRCGTTADGGAGAEPRGTTSIRAGSPAVRAARPGRSETAVWATTWNDSPSSSRWSGRPETGASGGQRERSVHHEVDARAGRERELYVRLAADDGRRIAADAVLLIDGEAVGTGRTRTTASMPTSPRVRLPRDRLHGQAGTRRRRHRGGAFRPRRADAGDHHDGRRDRWWGRRGRRARNAGRRALARPATRRLPHGSRGARGRVRIDAADRGTGPHGGPSSRPPTSSVFAASVARSSTGESSGSAIARCRSGSRCMAIHRRADAASTSRCTAEGAPSGSTTSSGRTRSAVGRTKASTSPTGPTDTWNLCTRPSTTSTIGSSGSSSSRWTRTRSTSWGTRRAATACSNSRMADRLAAAAMMAGHPNETRPDGLRTFLHAAHGRRGRRLQPQRDLRN